MAMEDSVSKNDSSWPKKKKRKEVKTTLTKWRYHPFYMGRNKSDMIKDSKYIYFLPNFTILVQLDNDKD